MQRMQDFNVFYIKDDHKIIVGRNDGELIEANLSLDDSNKLINNIARIKKFRSKILILEQLSSDEIVILTYGGGLFILDLLDYSIATILKEEPSKLTRKWKILVIDDQNFITVGNYHKIIHWQNDGLNFKPKVVDSSGPAIFCIGWLDKTNGLIFTNSYSGHSTIMEYVNSEVKIIETLSVESNIQKIKSISDDLLFAIDYYGRIKLYKKPLNDESLNLEEFNLTHTSGHSIEIRNNIIYFGFDDKIISLSTNLDDIFEYKTVCKQLRKYRNDILILTNNKLLKIENITKSTPENYISYKYIKLGLIGDSHVGKTFFCKYLQKGTIEDTDSTIGKHVWTIDVKGHEKSKKMLYYDLAGQRSELFTYFPLIKDAEIILFFYRGNGKETFDISVKYLQDIQQDIKKSKIYFIQTFSDQKQRVSDDYINKELSKYKLTLNDSVIKLDTKKRTGYDTYTDKIINSINWEDKKYVLNTKLNQYTEIFITSYYIQGKNVIKIKELLEDITTSEEILHNILLLYYSQGKIEYLKKEREIILNNQEYSELLSDIPRFIEEQNGFVETKKIIEKFGDTQEKKKYIRNIITFYKDNGIGLFLKEDKQQEIIVFEKQLSEKFNIGIDYENLEQYAFYFINKPKLFKTLVISLSFLENIKILDVAINSLYLKINDRSELVLSFEESLDHSQPYVTSTFQIFYTKNDGTDSLIIEEIKNMIFEFLESNLINLKQNYKHFNEINWTLQSDIVRLIFSNPFETSFFDYKNELNLDNNANKAEFLKDSIALLNSSYYSNNNSFLILGVKEENGKFILNGFKDDIDILSSKISQLFNEYLNFQPNVMYLRVTKENILQYQIDDIYQIPDQFHDIIVIHFIRKSNSVFELNRKIDFEKRRKRKTFNEGVSWIRFGSHTFLLRQYQREMLMEI